MGLFFGNARLIERYAETSILGETLRFDLQTFGIDQFKNFWLFGYGSGAFEQLFKIFYILPDSVDGSIAQHAHNDGLELLGEVGTLGISMLIVLSIAYFKKLSQGIDDKKKFARFILISLLLLILFIQSLVDFSMHTPGVVVLLITILSMGLINFKSSST
jgi:O-antigen ligase